MEFKIIITPDAEADLDRIINYLLFEKYNRQAASNVLNDFEETKRILSISASAIRLCDNPKLKLLGYRRINFLSHKYFMLYRIEENRVFVDNIFHASQNYENKIS